MARIRKFGCDRNARAKDVQAVKAEFVDLPQRGIGVVLIDMVSGEPTIDGDDFEDGAVVKVVQKYIVGDEGRANEILEHVLSELRERAGYIRPPERIAIRQGINCEIEITQSPIDLVENWIEQYDFENKPFEQVDVMRLMNEAFSEIEFAKKTNIADFTIRDLTVQNFMPFAGKQEIKEIPDGLISIVGRYGDQDGRSNRAGKSAALDAIQFALFGSCRSDITKDEYRHGFNRHGFDDKNLTFVSTKLEFADMEKPIMLKRNLGVSPFVDGVAVRVDQIHTLFKITKPEFVKTCYVQQGDLKIILKQGSTKLKEDIANWKSISDWKVVENWFSDHVSDLRSKVSELNGVIEYAEKQLEKECPSDAYQQELENRHAGLMAEHAEHKYGVERAAQLKKQIENQKKVDKYRQQEDKLELLAIQVEKSNSKHEKLSKNLGKMKAQIEIKRKEFRECSKLMDSGFGGTCPVDFGNCPRTIEISKNIKTHDKRLKAIKAECREMEKEQSDFEKLQRKVRSEHGKAKDQMEEIKSNLRIADELDDSGFDIEKALVEIEKYTEYNLDDVEQELKEIRDELSTIETTKRQQRQAKKDIEVTSKNRDELNHQLYLYGFCARTVSATGVPHMIIKSALVEIEGQTNHILEKLGTDHRIMFKTDFELSSKTLTDYCHSCNYAFPLKKTKECPECKEVRGKKLSNKIKTMVVEGGSAHSLESDSGAGKDMLALAMRIAVSRLIGSKILFLDEISGALDEYHRNMLLKLLHMLPDLGFKQIFIISHQHEIAESISNRIVVTRNQQDLKSELSKEGW